MATPTPWGHGLNNLESALPEDTCILNWPIMALLFFRRRFLKMFPINSHVKHWSPIVAPPYPWGPWFEQTIIYTMSESFHIRFIFSGPVVLEKKIFKWPHPIFAFSWLYTLGRGHGPSFEQTLIPFTQEYSVPRLVDSGPVVLDKKSKM